MENSSIEQINEKYINFSNNDIFFHIEFKIKNNHLIQQLEETINLHNEIVSCINENCVYNYNTMDLICLYDKIQNECKTNIEILKQIQFNNDKQLYEKCQHNFITDIIDINPEKSMTICYCTICEFTKK